MTRQFGRYPLPADDPLVAVLSAAVERLRARFERLDRPALAISDYSRRYLEGTLVNGLSKLNLYAFLIYLGMRTADGEVDLESGGIVDYGGGNGLLSLVAREAGIGTVTYTDIDEISAHDARRLGAALELEADHYVVGDLDRTIDYLREHAVACRALCSYDVIEHVYDIEGFLRTMAQAAPAPFRVVLGSGANAANPRLRRRLMQIQRQIETEDRAQEWGHYHRDSTRAYLSIRSDMIRTRAPSIASDNLAALAAATRGLATADIDGATDTFLRTGALPPTPSHPTNTCDPNTGNWAEHLMDPAELVATLSSAGLRADVVPGYYNPYLGWKGAVAGALNLAIAVSGRHGLMLAPYYVLIGERS